MGYLIVSMLVWPMIVNVVQVRLSAPFVSFVCSRVACSNPVLPSFVCLHGAWHALASTFHALSSLSCPCTTRMHEYTLAHAHMQLQLSRSGMPSARSRHAP